MKLTVEEVDDDDDGDGDDDDETGGALKARATKHLISVRALGPPSAPLDSYFLVVKGPNPYAPHCHL